MSDLYTNVYQGMETTPVNLYATNYQAGAQTAQYVPSTTSAIIEGAIKGIQTGQQITANAQQIELNQNKLDMLPTSNAQDVANLQQTQQLNQIRQHQIDQLGTDDQIKQAQLKREQALASIQANKAYIDNTTQDIQLAKTQQETTLAAQEAAKKKQLIDREEEFNNAWKNSDTKGKIGLLQQYGDVLANNKSLYQQRVDELEVLPDVPDQLKDDLRVGVDTRAIRDRGRQDSIKHQQTYEAAKADLENDPLSNQIASEWGPQDPSLLPRKIALRRRSDFAIYNGKILTDDTGRPLKPSEATGEAAAYNSETSLKTQGPYVAVARDSTGKPTNELVSENINEKSHEKFSKLVTEQSYIDGTYTRQQLDEYQKNREQAKKNIAASPSGGAAQKAEPPQVKPISLTQPTQSSDVAVTKIVVDKLHIDSPDQIPLAEHFKKEAIPLIQTQMQDPKAGSSPQHLQKMTELTINTARSRMSVRWASDPALRARYGNLYARTHLADQQITPGVEWGKKVNIPNPVAAFAGALNPSWPGHPAEKNMPGVWDYLRASSPEDLFMRTEQSTYEAWVNDALRSLREYYSKMMVGATGNAKADQALNSKLQGAMNGR